MEIKPSHDEVARAVLSLAQRHGVGAIDLQFTDVVRPQMNGKELAGFTSNSSDANQPGTDHDCQCKNGN